MLLKWFAVVLGFTVATPPAWADTGRRAASFDRVAVTFEGYRHIVLSVVPPERLVGVRVYDTRQMWTGTVVSAGDVIVMSTGGFMGVGARDIGVTEGSFTALRQVDGNRLRLYLDATARTLSELKGWD